MTELHEISLKKFCFPLLAIGFCIAITWNTQARRAPFPEIYSTLTSDTIPPVRKDSNLRRLTTSNSDKVTIPRDTIPGTDTTGRGIFPRSDSMASTAAMDTFNFRFSKDTLDAPVEYEAVDSGVLLVKEKMFILYGRTKTVYKTNTLTAPTVSMNQATNIVTAMKAVDSAGNVTARAKFDDGNQSFQSDTIQFNFKNQQGLTTNTFTQQEGDLNVHADVIKKINENTTFAKRLTMTTCEYDHPHFGFVANKGKFINNKIAVTGPIHPEFEGVPVPIYLPFGMFPLNKGRHSGLLPPQFAVTEQYGIGLEGLGYYHVINDYFDVTLRTNIYSYGGWSANIIPTYRKRYKYNGSLSLNIQRSKFNFKGDPDYSLVKTFNIAWSHSVDQRARPGVNFSASVNAGSTRYNEFVSHNPQQPFNNQLNSSITYSKTWQDKPFNLSLSANHNQNNTTRLVNIMLPDAGFTVSNIYPLQKKDPIGTPKWYEKLGVGYQGSARNQLSFYDTAKNTISSLLDTIQWGAQHRFPVSMSLPPLGPLLISPFISYEETWLTRRMGREWNDITKKIDTVYDKKGLFIDRQVSFGIGMNTSLYGTKQFKNSRLRHVVRPNFNFSYKPNTSKKYYDVIQVDTSGRTGVISQLQSGNNIYSSYGYGKFGGITFGIDNNLEMKKRGKKDTIEKLVRLIDGFGITSGYNFLQDSLKLLPVSLYFRTTLFEKVSITAQALYNPYQQDSTGQYINKFVWQGGTFRIGGPSSGSISMSTNFQSKPRDPNKGPSTMVPNRPITDPMVLADEQRLQDYKLRNPSEFVDFNIPWSVSLSYSLNFNKQFLNGKSKTTVSSNVSFNNSFSLTPKWNFTTNGYFDFNTLQLTMFTMSISRDMHCWQLAVNVTPITNNPSFSITISPKSGILQDLRVNRTRSFYNY